MKLSLFYISITIFLLSCKKVEKGVDYLNIECAKNAGIVIDSITLSRLANNRLNNEYLSLKQIDIQTDTFFLRVSKGVKKETRIFEFSYFNSIPSFKIYHFPIGVGGRILFDKNKNDIKDFTININPDGRIKSFLSQLRKNRILELPDATEIPSYASEDWYSGNQIEYSNKCSHKILFYTDVRNNAKKIIQANEVLGFLNFLQKEFNF